MRWDSRRIIQALPSGLIDHIRMPLFRNGYALVLSTGATSVLGFLYWIAAARLYDPEIVGLNAAALSTILFLSNIAQFNLYNALNRFLPAAGRATQRLILVSYLLSGAMAVAAGLVFLIGLPFWAPKLSFLISNPLLALGFIVFIVGWGIFAIQDSAFTGLRQAVWVPVKNLLFSILKIVLLVVFVRLIPEYGVLASWLAPLVIAVLIVNYYLFRFLVPRHAQITDKQREIVTGRQIAHYVTGDYIGAMFWVAATTLQTVIVAHALGAAASAFFYLPWEIAYALYLVSRMMCMSLVAEVAAVPSKLTAYSLHVLKQIARILIPVVAVIGIGAPWILQLFGRDYAAEGTTLLRLLSLSAIPQTVIVLYLSVARIQRRVAALVMVQVAESVLVIALIYIFLDLYGITGLGLAWVVSQSIIALILVLLYLRPVWLARVDLSIPLGMAQKARQVWHKRHDPQLVSLVNAILPQIMPACEERCANLSMKSWQAQGVFSTVGDVQVIALGNPGLRPEALLKMGSSEEGEMSLRMQSQVLSSLHTDPRLRDLTPLLPKVLAEGKMDDRYYLVEKMLPGVDARFALRQADLHERVLFAAVASIQLLHQRTASAIEAGPDLLGTWVDDRLNLLQTALSQRALMAQNDQKIDKLADELYQSLEGRRLPVGWTHGDFSPGNILISPDAKKVEGLVDWDLASANDLPMVDIMHLLLTTRMLVEKRELGHLVSYLIAEDDWSPTETAVLNDAQQSLPGEPIETRTLVLLSWLHHVTSNLSKSVRFKRHWVWMTKNVEAVLESL